MYKGYYNQLNELALILLTFLLANFPPP